MATTQQSAPQLVTKQQVKKIHVLKSVLKMEDEVYQGALYQAFEVDSSTQLTFAQAEEVIRYFEREAVSLGVWEVRRGAEKHKRLNDREGYASSAQLGFIETLWSQVTRAENKAEASRRLRTFLYRQAGVSDLRFLRKANASKVICALKAMKQL